MKGFFSKERTQIPYKSEGGRVHSCTSCGLHKFVLSPRMKPFGKGDKGIMVIGEAPGEEEDKKGRPWQGKAGRLLQEQYRKLGIDLFEDCICLNAVNCRPTDKKGNNRTPTEFEVACCRQRVIQTIEKHKPKVVIIHGGTVLSSLIGHKWRKDLSGISKWRGWTIPDRDYKAWLCPTFHPSFIERQERETEINVVWAQDIKQAIGMADVPFPSGKKEEDCVVMSDDIEKVLTDLIDQRPELLAFDIETTGLKPYNKKVHEIVSIAFCTEPDKAYAIPYPKEEKHLALLKELLEHPDIGKVAANMMFEDTWLNIMSDIEVKPWRWDTMQAAHVLDNRPGITGLKFQSYVRFGVLGYDDDVVAYLKSPGTNTPNDIKTLARDKAGMRRLLLYNGLDAILEYRLALLQIEEFE